LGGGTVFVIHLLDEYVAFGEPPAQAAAGPIDVKERTSRCRDLLDGSKGKTFGEVLSRLSTGV
jgi:hypothetical protein